MHFRHSPLVLLLGACADPPPAGSPGPELTAESEVVSPDIVLVTIDTLRADRIGAYGDPLAHTPNMDKLAKEAVLFREAHAVTPLTLPSHASILTGLLPRNHGMRDNGALRMDAAVPTLAEALQAKGYVTGAFVGAYVLDAAWGLDQGFDTYHAPFHPSEVSKAGAFGEVELPGVEVVNAALGWWTEQGRGEKPRFLWVHLYEPHSPWSPGLSADPYRADVARADTLVGTLIQRIGADPLFVLTSDHGEGLWEGGEREHGALIGRSITRVPLILRPPGGLAPKPGEKVVLERPTPRNPPSLHLRPQALDPELDLNPVPDAPVARRVIEEAVSGLDIAPTLAAYAGITLTADGRSLRAAVEGERLPVQAIYAETWYPALHLGWAPMFAAQAGSLRLERGARDHTYDWQTDPAQKALLPVDPTLNAQIQAGRGESEPERQGLPAETAARLQALGYLTEAPQHPTGADPRDKALGIAAWHAADALADPAQRVAALEALLRLDPGLTDARLSLALALAETRELAAARRLLDQILEGSPNHMVALNDASLLARAAKDPATALRFAKRMQALNPNDARGWRNEVAIHVDTGDAAGVIRAAEAGIAAAPTDPNLHYLLGIAQIQEGDPLKGKAAMEAARRHGTRATDTDLWLALAHEKLGDVDAAVRHYEGATRSLPGDLRPWAMAGLLLYRSNRCEEAKPYLVNVIRRGAGKDPKIQEAAAACLPNKEARP